MNRHLYKVLTPKGELRHVSLMCKHEEQWPPAFIYLDDNIEILRQREQVTELDYEAIKVWKAQCGKKNMDDNCAECDLCEARVRVRTPRTGRYQEKNISFAAFSKTSRTDMHLLFEPGVLTEEQEPTPEPEPEAVVTEPEPTPDPEPEETKGSDELSDILDELDA